MPQGRKIDWDSRVTSLVSELREALLERERARLESRVDSMVAGLLDGVAPTKPQPKGKKGRRGKAVAAASTSAKPARRGVYKRSAAQRKAQADKMRAYWAARRKQKATTKAGGRKAKVAQPSLAE